MDIALSIRSQMLATLLAALETDALQVGEGVTVTGKVTSLGADGEAMLAVRGQQVAVLFGPRSLGEARLAFETGMPLSLRIDGTKPGQPATATLIPTRDAGPGETQSPRGGLSPLVPAAAPQMQPQQSGPQLPGLVEQRAALALAMVQAGSNQKDIGALLANLETLLDPRTVAQQTAASTLAPKVLAAAASLLGLRLDLGDADATAGGRLRQAVALSGIAHEARIAGGSPTDTALAANDLKSMLALLKSALAEMAAHASGLPSEAATSNLAKVAQGQPQTSLPPPHRDAMPAGQAPAEDDTASWGTTRTGIAAALGQQVDGALDRVRLLQAASLPADLRPPGVDNGQPSQRWLMELPMVIDGRSQMLPLRIEREPERRNGLTRQGALWRVRFALDGEPLGPIHGIVTWHMRQLGISLWAGRPETRDALAATAPELRRALGETRFENVEIDIHAGEPVTPVPAKGVLVDKAS